jgi:RNA polymerase sigma-70 factor (sigma-E family)
VSVREDFDDYVRASSRRLLRLAFLLTGDHHDAEDLLQTAYAKALPRWHKIGGIGNPDAYLRRVMVNTNISWWRRRRGREVLEGDVLEPEPRGGETDFDQHIVLQDGVLRALRSLPPRQRTVVVLRYYCDVSEAETASIMGVSIGTVKSQASRAVASLRTTLERTGYAREEYR